MTTKFALSLVVLALVGVAFSQLPPEDTATRPCLNQCQQDHLYVGDRPTPCCSCCNNSTGQTCHETSIRLACCNSGENFCGCLSSRAFCAGSIYNSTANVNTFGVCYDPTNEMTGVCCYNPGPNAWGLCPRGTTCCGPTSSYRYNCCTQQEECIQDTTSSEQYFCRNINYGNEGPCAQKSCLFGTEQQRCCNDLAKGALCYKSETHVCKDTTTSTGQSGFLLCAKGDGACGTQCYDVWNYKCCSGTLYSRNNANAPAGCY